MSADAKASSRLFDLLKARLNRHYRIHATGICFSVFGIGALLLSFLWFPILKLRHAGNVEATERAVQQSLRWAFALFMSLMQTVGVMRWRVSGTEHLKTPGVLVIANHPTLVDTVALMSLMPQVDAIVKAGLWRNAFLRWPVRWAGYIPNDESKPEELVQRCRSKLQAGRSLLVFPEGTRSEPGKPLLLRRGAAQIALASGCMVVPATITCTPMTLIKGEKWWQVPSRKFALNIVIDPAFDPAAVLEPGLSGPVAARRLTQYFGDYFNRRLAELAP